MKIKATVSRKTDSTTSMSTKEGVKSIGNSSIVLTLDDKSADLLPSPAPRTITITGIKSESVTELQPGDVVELTFKKL